MDEENFAQMIRAAGKELRDAEVRVATTEADLKREVAKVMVVAEVQGHKSAVAQARFADESDSVYDRRVEHGLAKGELAAAKAELKAVEIAFEHWRTRAANLRMERKAYSA